MGVTPRSDRYQHAVGVTPRRLRAYLKPTPPNSRSTQGVNVQQMVDMCNQMRATEPCMVGFVRASMKEPRVLRGLVLQAPGAGSASLHQQHIWAFFDSSYTTVNWSSGQVKLNADRSDPHKLWLVGEGQKRSTMTRGMARDPILGDYKEVIGSLGVRLRGLRGHVTLAYGLWEGLGK